MKYLFMVFAIVGSFQSFAADSESGLFRAIQTTARKNDLLEVFHLQNLTGQDAVLRLIVAETMASHCPSVEAGKLAEIEMIMKGIAKVIRNRSKVRNSERELAVVFEKNQFNSSVAKYACSEIDGFLDPQLFNERVSGLSAGQLWLMARSAYEAAWGSKVFDHNDEKVKNYYLHQHNRRGDCKFKPPSWVKESKEIKLVGNTELVRLVRQCIGFYLL